MMKLIYCSLRKIGQENLNRSPKTKKQKNIFLLILER